MLFIFIRFSLFFISTKIWICSVYWTFFFFLFYFFIIIPLIFILFSHFSFSKIIRNVLWYKNAKVSFHSYIFLENIIYREVNNFKRFFFFFVFFIIFRFYCFRLISAISCLGYLDRPIDAQERYIAAAFQKGYIYYLSFVICHYFKFILFTCI